MLKFTVLFTFLKKYSVLNLIINKRYNSNNFNNKNKELSEELIEILIGLVLGDLHIRRRYKNTCLCFTLIDSEKKYQLKYPF